MVIKRDNSYGQILCFDTMYLSLQYFPLYDDIFGNFLSSLYHLFKLNGE